MRVVPTYPLFMTREFWHGGQEHVSARQSQEERWQAASLFQCGREPAGGEEPDGTTDGAVFGGNQRWAGSELAQDTAGLRRESAAAHDPELVPRGPGDSRRSQR